MSSFRIPTCGVALAACLLLTCSTPLISARTLFQATKPNIDGAIGNFALNLEYLEAQAYWIAAYGKPFNSSALGMNGMAATGGRKARLSPPIQALAEELANTELKHVLLLRGVLGAGAVPAPMIDISVAAFSYAATAAFGGVPVTFDPYASDIAFLLMAYIFEDVGVTAYHGALPAITDAGILSAAGGLLGTESYQAGAVRSELVRRVDSDTKLGGHATVGTVANAIAALRSALSGAVTDAGILLDPINSVTGSATHKGNKTVQIAGVDSVNGLVFSRSIDQVLGVVYGTGNASKPGLFFPQGISQ